MNKMVVLESSLKSPFLSKLLLDIPTLDSSFPLLHQPLMQSLNISVLIKSSHTERNGRP